MILCNQAILFDFRPIGYAVTIRGLVHADQSKIIIPTVFREDYLNGLRRLTRKGDPSVIIKAISRVRQFSANIIGEDFEETRRYLEGTNAFKDGDEYILRF